ncbi:MAG TPA: hypothetical protein VJN43_21990 [Bryobacteraceae bacterium]|nr:hypothetical protein [Bryobacteraceae bacterium]
MRLHKVTAAWVIAAGVGVSLLAQTKVDLRTQAKSIDFSGASLTIPVRTGTSLPVTCTTPEWLFLTGSGILYFCTAANIWTPAGTVTNASGALTPDMPLFGAGGSDSKPGTKTGSGNQVVVSQSPTIVSPVIADFTNMQHGHVNAAGGGQLGVAAITAASLSGNGAKLGTVSGTLASGDCAKFDASGNIVDSGAVCGSGGANFRQTFTSATSVSLAHNLNSTGVVFTCYDTSTPPLWILPKSAALTDANHLTINFASAQSGTCVVNANGTGISYSSGTGINVTGSTIAIDRTSVPNYLTVSASLTFGSIGQATCAQVTMTLTGAATGDSIAPGWPSTLEAGLAGSMFVSAANTVAVRLCNLSGAPLTPAVQSFRATILRSF